MSDTSLVPAGSGRYAVTGLHLPSPPPTRIYLSGYEYKITAPRVSLPAVLNVIKLILNWVGPAGRIAKNILYTKLAGGTGSSSDPTFLVSVANQFMVGAGASTLSASWSSAWTLQSVTARDMSGTSATAVSTVAAIPGNVTGGSHPPQVAMTVSWQIAESYRGGKPRTYQPGVPFTATAPAGSSTIDPTFASNADTAYTATMNYMNTHPILGTTLSLGTVSYYHGHAVRPTPVFYSYTGVKVHERLDSQRRRSGPESSFPVTP